VPEESGGDTQTGQTPAPTSQPDTNLEWAELVLQDGGFPVTPNNVEFMLQWMERENKPSTWTGTAGANNPLNNGLGSGGGSGLGSYPDLTTAAAYAAQGINGGISGTGPLAAALKTGTATPDQLGAALIMSNWASSHYGGTWDGSYKAPIYSAEASAKNGATSGVAVGSGVVHDVISGIGDVLGSIPGVKTAESVASEAQNLQTITGDLVSATWWKRIGLGVAGAVVVVVGFVVFFASTDTGKKSISEATQEATAGMSKGGGGGSAPPIPIE
jgi:hypothetical protein